MKIYFIILVLLLPTTILAQKQKLNCTDIKDGYFYYYPKNSADHYTTKREGKYDVEINSKTGDSSVWEVDWKSDCVYSLKYISGNEKMTDDGEVFLKKHKLVYEILSITDDYYTFKGYIDKASGNPIQTDIMWLHEKLNVASNEVFKQIINNGFLKKVHFSDTSKYAVLYIYRPGKFLNSAMSFFIYFDDNIMCLSKNNSGYIFAILKEGSHQLKSKLDKQEFNLTVDFKFGKKYYIKSYAHWGIGVTLEHKVLELEQVDASIGEGEFLDVDQQ